MTSIPSLALLYGSTPSKKSLFVKTEMAILFLLRLNIIELSPYDENSLQKSLFKSHIRSDL